MAGDAVTLAVTDSLFQYSVETGTFVLMMFLSTGSILLGFMVVISLVVLVWLLRYVMPSFRERSYTPVSWREATGRGEVSERLLALERNYADKVRFFNFWIQARRIGSEGIRGDIAELGVYKGETAAVLHALFPKRDLYLFDTFEGFTGEDLATETGKAAEYTTESFSDTSVELVLANVGGGDRVKVFKGDFPSSAEDVDAVFAMVSMDADLYQPTRAGLEFFWPRLKPGGVILVHDHDSDWPGITRAVEEFREATGCLVVPLPDQNSTIMIFRER